MHKPVAKRSVGTVLLIVFCVTLLASCADKSRLNYNLEEYTSRLSRVLDIDIPPTTLQPKHQLPPASQMVNTLPSINIEITELLSLRQCELSTLVANKNTALGKVQLPSQQLIYELSLVKALRDCETVIPPSTGIHEQLQSWRLAKESQLSYRWSNFLQSSQDVRASLTQALDVNASEDAAVRGYFYLNKLNSNIAQMKTASEVLESTSELENHLYELQKARFPASTWNEQSMITGYLLALNSSLSTALPEVNCTDGRPSDTAKILRNVFYLFFIEQVQPVASKVTALHYKIDPVFSTWLNEPTLSLEFKAFIKGNHKIGFAEYQSAVQQHVQLWQTFLARCNLSPTASG